VVALKAVTAAVAGIESISSSRFRRGRHREANMFTTLDAPEEGNRRPMAKILFWAIGIIVAVTVVWALV
jgi:hypothetical protein